MIPISCPRCQSSDTVPYRVGANPRVRDSDCDRACPKCGHRFNSATLIDLTLDRIEAAWLAAKTLEGEK
jgi:hypothetical protein